MATAAMKLTRRAFLAVLAGAVACPALPKPVPRAALQDGAEYWYRADLAARMPHDVVAFQGGRRGGKTAWRKAALLLPR